MSESSVSAHKESSGFRVKRDEDDINKIINTLNTVMSNPFDADAYEEEVPHSKLAKGLVMPEELSLRLLDAERLGAEEMKSFVSKRLHTNKVGFWEPFHHSLQQQNQLKPS